MQQLGNKRPLYRTIHPLLGANVSEAIKELFITKELLVVVVCVIGVTIGAGSGMAGMAAAIPIR